MNDRYKRHTAFYGIGESGQQKIRHSSAAVVGMGALGTINANHLVRAGIGRIILIDPDKVEISNLQRQILYTEEDVKNGKLKTEAAEELLEKINSETVIRTETCSLNRNNAEALLSDADVIIDASDNLETRLAINEACVKLKKPWIYGGVLGSSGMTAVFLNEEDSPCFQCLTGNDPHASETDCENSGVLNAVTGVIASLQSAEAMKILTGSLEQVRKDLLYIDIWKSICQTVPIKKNPDCPVCSRNW